MLASPHPSTRSTQPLLSWIIPYDQREIVAPLEQIALREQLAAMIERLNAAPTPGRFSSSVRYQGHVAGDSFTLSGPIANRRFRLLTRGMLYSDPAGARIDLTLRLATGHVLLTLGQLLFLWGWALMIHFPLILVLFLSGFMYLGTTLLFRYEASQIVQQLLQAASPQPEAGTVQGSIIADEIGSRCGVCGGYVRRDATFCKHCKQPFNQ